MLCLLHRYVVYWLKLDKRTLFDMLPHTERFGDWLTIFVTPILQDLVKDLQIAKKQTWAEKQRASSKYEEERKVNLANKVCQLLTDQILLPTSSKQSR